MVRKIAVSFELYPCYVNTQSTQWSDITNPKIDIRPEILSQNVKFSHKRHENSPVGELTCLLPSLIMTANLAWRRFLDSLGNTKARNYH
jgi:hypothetical protein